MPAKRPNLEQLIQEHKRLQEKERSKPPDLAYLHRLERELREVSQFRRPHEWYFPGGNEAAEALGSSSVWALNWEWAANIIHERKLGPFVEAYEPPDKPGLRIAHALFLQYMRLPYPSQDDVGNQLDKVIEELESREPPVVDGLRMYFRHLSSYMATILRSRFPSLNEPLEAVNLTHGLIQPKVAKSASSPEQLTPTPPKTDDLPPYSTPTDEPEDLKPSVDQLKAAKSEAIEKRLKWLASRRTIGTYEDWLLITRENIVLERPATEQGSTPDGELRDFFVFTKKALDYSIQLCLFAFMEEPPSAFSFVRCTLNLHALLHAADAAVGFYFTGSSPVATPPPPRSVDPISLETTPTREKSRQRILELVARVNDSPASFLDWTERSHAHLAFTFSLAVQSIIAKSIPSENDKAFNYRCLHVEDHEFFRVWRDQTVLSFQTEEHEYFENQESSTPITVESGEFHFGSTSWRLPEEAEFRQHCRVLRVGLHMEEQRAVDSVEKAKQPERPQTTSAQHTGQSESTERKQRSTILRIDRSKGVAIYHDEVHPITQRQGEVLHNLLDARGAFVTGRELKEFPDSNERPDRIIDRLPEPLLALIERKTGTGYRIPWPLK